VEPEWILLATGVDTIFYFPHGSSKKVYHDDAITFKNAVPNVRQSHRESTRQRRSLSRGFSHGETYGRTRRHRNQRGRDLAANDTDGYRAADSEIIKGYPASLYDEQPAMYSVQPFKRLCSVSSYHSHLQGIVPYRMEISHKISSPSPTKAVT
jgi:hypothetical protein